MLINVFAYQYASQPMFSDEYGYAFARPDGDKQTVKLA